MFVEIPVASVCVLWSRLGIAAAGVAAIGLEGIRAFGHDCHQGLLMCPEHHRIGKIDHPFSFQWIDRKIEEAGLVGVWIQQELVAIGTQS